MPPSSSALRRDPSKRLRRAAYDGGTPLTDELLLAIWDRCPDLADLVRFAATCRRWRRLVSAEAAFICRTPRRPLGKFVRPLALGFFHRHEDAVPRFVPTASAARRFPGLLKQPRRSPSTMVDDGLFNIVASRNGLLVVDLRHRKHDRALIKLCVCNPMTGAVHILPPLCGKGGKDGRGYYACTVLTAEDDEKTVDPPRSSSYFRLIMIYTRGEFTMFRSYSSEDGRWGEEAKVTNSRLGKKQMGLTHSGVVHPGGKLVYWLAKDVVFLLWLETLQSAVVSFPPAYGHKFDMVNTLLGISPEGMLCAVQLRHKSLRRTNPSFSIRITTCTKHRWWETGELIQPELPLPADVINIRLQWFCDKSGVVFFSVVSGDTDHRRYEMYALSLKTLMAEKLVCLDGGSNNPWEQVHGYEMGLLVAYLASLAEPERIEDM